MVRSSPALPLLQPATRTRLERPQTHSNPIALPVPLSTRSTLPVEADPDRVGLLSLPDELISSCMATLDARDLVQLELTCRRTREVVANDALRWRQAVEQRWSTPVTDRSASPQDALLEAAASIAGSWKRLYSEKHLWDRQHHPWITPTVSETEAMIDIITGARSPPIPAGSPTSVMLSSAPPDLSPTMTVVILIDGSSSVTEEDFNSMKNLSSTFLTSLNITHPGSSACLIQFNQYPRVELDLTPLAKGQPVAALSTMEQLMGSTDIAAPIHRAREILADKECPPGDKVIVMLTDGQTHAEELRLAEAEARGAAEDAGARLFTFGVGRDVDEVGLEKIAASTRAVHNSANRFVSGHDFEGIRGGCYFTLRRLKK
mmetsp:Transcript_39923/g.97881  ORF Transcript_39923/g.97881 Transcript_39923/m.97881 type:complete len:375 (-) Transcript_39923:1213-2337(-)